MRVIISVPVYSSEDETDLPLCESEQGPSDLQHAMKGYSIFAAALLVLAGSASAQPLIFCTFGQTEYDPYVHAFFGFKTID